MIKGVSLEGLNKRQKTTMKRHGEHDAAKHLKEMVKMVAMIELKP